MTFIALDMARVSVGEDRDFYCFEFGGLLSGMAGFEQIYQDHRVANQVAHMLQQEYGELKTNTYAFQFAKEKIGHQNPSSREYRKYIKHMSKRQHKIYDNCERSERFPFFQSRWLGEEDCSVINYYNNPVANRTVNPYEIELVARNKFLQISLDQHHGKDMKYIPGELYGVKDFEYERIIDLSDKFIVKPFDGARGGNIKIISKEELLRETKTWNKTFNQVLQEQKLKGHFRDMFIIQPFLSTQTKNIKYHTSIRSIVCNGEFVDAYVRVSEQDPVVNLSRGSNIATIEDSSKEIIKEKSELYVADIMKAIKKAYSFAKKKENKKKKVA